MKKSESEKKGKRISCVLTALFLSVFALFSFLVVPCRTVARAEENEQYGYMTTTIEKDLEEIGVNRLLYQQNSFGKHELLQVVEFCYSDNEDMLQYYDLYLYVYNPIARKLEKESNVVNMAVQYDEEGKPSSYENVALSYCDATDDHLFYKFKIATPENALSVVCAYDEKFNVRRYDIAGLQIELELEGTAIDEAQGFTYYFSGYGKGLGAGAERSSTLKCKKVELDTIELEVGHTNYRTEIYDANDICESLDTVYFAVEESYFENYGGLQKIKAEWYEYKTSPIFVTSDSGAYDALSPYIGKDIGEKYEDLEWRVLWDVDTYSKTTPSTFPTSSNGTSTWYREINGVYNKRSEFPTTLYNYFYATDCELETEINWLFECSDVTKRDDYIIDGASIESWMEDYADAYGSDELLLGKYAKELFVDSIDERRLKYLKDYEKGATSGYVLQEIDADEKRDLTSIKDLSWWENFLGESPFDSEEYAPIVTIGKEDIEGLNASSFAEKYLINEHDQVSVYDACKTAIREGKRFVLFRFAKTDYYSATARFDHVASFGESGYYMSAEDGYVAQETVFLGFDIISLTFRNEHDVETVIGVAADPINIVNDITPPTDLDPNGWWNPFDDGFGKEDIVVLIVAVVIIMVVAMFVLFIVAPEAFQMLMYGIGTAFKWIGSCFSKFFKKIRESFKRAKKASAKRKKKGQTQNDKKQNGKEKTESKSPKGNVGKKGGKSKKSGDVSKGTKPQKAGKRKRTSKSKKRKK